MRISNVQRQANFMPVIIIYSYSYVMHFWSQIVAFYFLQFINVWISVMVLFHNTECGNKGNKLKSLSLLSLFSLRLHRFSLWGCHVMNERLKPEDSNRWTNSVQMLRMRDWTNHSPRRLVLSRVTLKIRTNRSRANPSLTVTSLRWRCHWKW